MAVCLEMSHCEQQALKAWLSHQPRPGSPVCGSQSPRELPCSLNKAFSVSHSSSVWNFIWRESSHNCFLFCADVSAGVLEKAEINTQEEWRIERKEVSGTDKRLRWKEFVSGTKPMHYWCFFSSFQGFSFLSPALPAVIYFDSLTDKILGIY